MIPDREQKIIVKEFKPYLRISEGVVVPDLYVKFVN